MAAMVAVIRWCDDGFFRRYISRDVLWSNFTLGLEGFSRKIALPIGISQAFVRCFTWHVKLLRGLLNRIEAIKATIVCKLASLPVRLCLPHNSLS